MLTHRSVLANGCPVDQAACRSACEKGHLEALKVLVEEFGIPFDAEECITVARAKSHSSIVDYLVRVTSDKQQRGVCRDEMEIRRDEVEVDTHCD